MNIKPVLIINRSVNVGMTVGKAVKVSIYQQAFLQPSSTGGEEPDLLLSVFM